MCWNEWKINFPIFSFWVMVDFVLKIYRKLADFECKIDHISKTKSRKHWFFIRFSTFRIFHVNMNTLFSWSVLNRIQINTKKKVFYERSYFYLIIVKHGPVSMNTSKKDFIGIEERLHTKLFINSTQSLCFYYL